MQTAERIGTKIMEARKARGLSQAQLAQQLAVSAQAVGKWERGQSLPDVLTLDQLAEVFDVDLNYFSGREVPVPAAAPAPRAGDVPGVVGPQTAGGDVDDEDDAPSAGAGVGDGAGADDAPASAAGPRDRALDWDLSHTSWTDCDFSGLSDLGPRFSSSNIKGCKFVGSDLTALILKSNNVIRNDFSDSELDDSQFRSSNITTCQFKDCSLRKALFSHSNVKGCDFSDADLSQALIKSCCLTRNKIAGVTWDETVFRGSQFVDLVFEGEITDCAFEGCSWSRVTFKGVRFTNTFFKGQKMRRVQFVDCEADNITYAFLKNAKADLSGVKLIAE